MESGAEVAAEADAAKMKVERAREIRNPKSEIRNKSEKRKSEKRGSDALSSYALIICGDAILPIPSNNIAGCRFHGTENLLNFVAAEVTRL